MIPRDDLDEIKYVLRHPTDGYATGNCRDIRRAHRLVRQGYLRRIRHSEHVRGERRFYWWRFEVTSDGRRVLERGA